MEYGGITFIGNALFFGFFSMICIFRFINLWTNGKQKYWIWIPFYIFLFFCSIVRGGSLVYIGLTLENKEDDNFQEFLMASPYMVYLFAYLLLICHFLVYSINAHIDLANDRNIFREELPNLTKKTLILMFIIFPIFLIVFSILSALAILGILEQWILIKIISYFNILSPVILLAYYIFLNVKFSGRPYRNQNFKKNTRTILKICILWVATRITSGVVYLALEIRDLRDLIELEEFGDEGKDKFVNVILIFVFFIVLEILPLYFSLDHPLKESFVKDDLRTDEQRPEGETLLRNTVDSQSNDTSERKSSVTIAVQPTIKDFLINEEDIDLGIKIYEKKNGLGVINKGKLKEDLVILRIIQFDRISRYNIENIIRDLEKLIILNNDNKNVSLIKGYYIGNDNKVVLAYNNYENGSLYDYIHVKKNNLSTENKSKIALGIIKGIEYLHQNNLVHCHLSTKNILLDDELNPLISDYGFLNLYELANIFNKYSNKNSYSPPEILSSSSKFYKLSEPVNEELKKIDIYSYGMILWEIVTSTVPFDIKLSEVKKYVLEEKVRPEVPSNIDVSLSTLIRNCWDSDPSKRPSEEEIISFFQEKSTIFKNI